MVSGPLRGLFGDKSPLSGMGLRTQYALVLLGLLVVLGAVVAGTTEFFKQQTVDQERAELGQTADATAELVDQGYTDVERVIRGQSTRIHANFSNKATVLARTVEDQRGLFNSALVTDDGGRVRAMAGVTDEEALRDTVEEGESPSYIAEPLDGRTYVQESSTGNEATVIIGTPVVEGGEPVGVLAGLMVFPSDEQAADAVETGGGPPSFLRPAAALNTTTQSVQVLDTDGDEETVLYQSGGTYEDNITATAGVASTDWTVMIERDRGALTSRLRILQAFQFGSLLVVFLSVFALGFYQYRTTLRQTGRLLDGFEELRRGAFDHRLAFSGAREWERISEGFNRLATGLTRRETAIRERERQIRDREQRLSVLNRVLRHNLQNDLGVVLSYVSMLPDADSREEREHTAERIRRSIEGLIDHSEKARQLERLMDNAEEGLTTLDITTPVEDLATEYNSEYPETDVTVQTPDSAPVSAVVGIEFGIEALVENAVQHNRADDPEIELRVTRADERTHVEVRDNGPGIPEHERTVLDQGRETSLEHGSGIGLWLARWAVEKSGGRLDFDDQSDGGRVTATLWNADSDRPETGDGVDVPADDAGLTGETAAGN